MKIAIKTAHGYLSWQPDGRLEYRPKVGPWEEMEVEGLEVPVVPPVVPPVQPPVTTNPAHVGPGPLTVERAREVIFATSREYKGLLAVFPTEEQAVAAALEMLRRVIWHLQLAGYQAARQRNPSGVLSGDKLCISFPDRWHVYDIMSLGFAGRATTMQMLEITGENPVADSGIPD